MLLRVGINNIRGASSKAITVLLTFLVFGCAFVVRAQGEMAAGQSVQTALTSVNPVAIPFVASQGDVVEFTVKHTSTSLKATIKSPSGKKLISLTSATLFTGTLELLARAPETGNYTIVLESERPGKAVGQIEITFKGKRDYLQSDDARLKALSLMSEAQSIITTLYGLKTDRSKKDIAKAYLNEALSICETISDRRCAAAAALDLGQFLYDEFVDFGASEAALRKALNNYSQINDEAGLALTKLRISLVISLLRGRDPEVMALLEEGLTSARKLGDRPLEGRLLVNKGRVLRDWGEGAKALPLLKEAISLTGENDLDGKLRALVQTSSVVGGLNDPAYEYYLEDSYGLFQKLQGRVPLTFLTFILNLKASIAINKGDFKTYEILNDRCIAIAEILGQRWQLARFYYWAGIAYLERSKLKTARAYLEKSLKMYESVAPREAQAAYNGLGLYNLKTNQFATARALFTKAVALNEANGDRFATVNSMNNLVDADLKLGNYEEAMKTAENSYAYALSLRGNYYTAVAINGFEIGLLRDTTERMISAAYRMHKKTQDISYLERALELQEVSISRSLANTVRDSGFEIASALDRGVLKELSDVQTRISELEIEIQKNSKSKEDLRKSLIQSLAEYEDLLDKSRRLNPNSSLFNEMQHLSANDIRGLLDDDTVLVQYSIKFNESHVWVIGKGFSQFYLLGTKEEINSLSNNYTKSISNYSTFHGKPGPVIGLKLSDAILKPILKDIAPFKRLLIVPDEDLVKAPFAGIPILKNGQPRYLGEEFEIAVLPSVTTLLALRSVRNSRVQPDPRNLVAVIADPVFDSSDERIKRTDVATKKASGVITSSLLKGTTLDSLTRLPFTSVEARRIADLAGNRGTIFSGVAANRSTVMNGVLSKFRIIHFATHGFINFEKPELSSIALSMYDESGNPQNGFLRAVDIYALRLKADLVVLGGCQTAGVAQTRGDNLAGLTRGFMYAGVPTVMASFWKVDDSATSFFMEYFYDALLSKGMTPPAALRYAQLKFIASPRWNSPKYWAAFTVQGEYDVTFK